LTPEQIFCSFVSFYRNSERSCKQASSQTSINSFQKFILLPQCMSYVYSTW
jgi:hypothetical protein